MPPTLRALSRAANARMSAHDTVSGHAASNCILASSITSNPRKLGLLAKWSLSAIGLPGVDASNTEPSQP